MKFTIFGASGFIGSELRNFLKNRSVEVDIITRSDSLPIDRCLGTIVYCAGHGDCENDPLNVIDANLNLLKKVVNRCKYKRLIYISSTRVYLGSEEASEFSDLKIINSDNRKLFNLSKLCAEEICLKSDKDNVILRLSNVYGKAIKSPLFLPSIIRDAINNGVVNMYVTSGYEKDYIFIGDVLDFIFEISYKDNLQSKIYNVASGVNTKAQDIARVIEDNTECIIKWHEVTNEDIFPITNLALICREVNWSPRNVLDDISEMIDLFKRALNNAG